MNASAKTDLPSSDLRSAVHEYATRLLSVLDKQIGVITETADRISREVYQAASLQQEDPRKHTDWKIDRNQTGFERDASPPPAPPVLESKLLQTWRDEGYGKPLLIVAPAGSGKSCLLESFAWKMAKDLLDETLWPESEPLPTAVPLVISLAKLQSTPLNQYLTRAEIDITQDSDTSLQTKHLEYLRQQHRLVLLIDGFDEAPSAHKELAKQLPKWEGRFALTSRPGHGGETIVPDLERQRTLEGLTEAIASKYVLSYFTTRPCHGKSKEQIVQQLFAPAWKTHFGRLLRRPLYLKTWCDFVWKRHGNETPKTMGQLAHQLFLKTLKSRNQFESLFEETEERQRAIEGFQDWFGALGLHFARSGFREQTAKDLVKLGFLDKKQSKLEVLEGTYSFEKVAVQCGLLTRDLDSYFLPKVPLTEYLIGKYLADDAIRQNDSPQMLIETFRKWIWQPGMHDILDYTFDELWHSSAPRETQWGNELLAWARGVGKQDSIRCQNAEEPTQDDLIHPFATSVLRWWLLASHMEEEERRTAISEMIKEIYHGLKYRLSITEILGSILTDDRLLQSTIEFIFTEMVNSTGDDDAEYIWKQAIIQIARQVPESVAEKMIDWLVSEFVSEKWNYYSSRAQRDAIWEVARRVSRDRAGCLISDWILRHDSIVDDPDAQDFWRQAVCGASDRVSENVAEDVVRLLIAECNKVNESWEKHQDWRLAIFLAARNLREARAEGFIYECMAEMKRIKDSTEKSSVWLAAIRGAAGIVNESAVPRVVTFLFSELKYNNIDSLSQWDIANALSLAASRVNQSDASNLIRSFIGLHDDVKEAAVEQYWLQEMILCASRRVKSTEAEEVMESLIREHEKALKNGRDLEVWVKAVRAVAFRISGNIALNLVLKWMILHDAANDAPEVQKLWRAAIRGVANRVQGADAVRVVSILLNAFDSADACPTVQSGWIPAIWNAAGCLKRIDSITDNVQSSLRICQLMSKRLGELKLLTFRVAANNPSLSVVSIRPESPSSVDVKVTPAVTFQAVLRRDQILDEKLLVAPPLVRSVFIEVALKSLEDPVPNGSKSISPLGIPNDPIEAIKFARRNIQLLPDDVGPKEARRGFEKRLRRIEEGDLLPLNSPDNELNELSNQSDRIVKRVVHRKANVNLTRPIINLAGVRSGKFRLLCFYEIGFEYLNNRCCSLSKIAAAFKEMADGKIRSDGMPSRTLDPQISSHTTQISRYCDYAMEIFGKHFLADDRFKGEIGEQGLAPLFLPGKDSDYENLSELGREAWRLCRQDLILYGLVKETD